MVSGCHSFYVHHWSSERRSSRLFNNTRPLTITPEEVKTKEAIISLLCIAKAT